MDPSLVPCETCRKGIPEADFEIGVAISVLGKNYCSGCKNEAVKNISLDDIVAQPTVPPPPPPPKPPPKRPAGVDVVRLSVPEKLSPPPSPKPPARPTPPAREVPQSRTPPPRRRTVVRRPTSRAAVVGGSIAAVGAGLAIVVIFAVTRGGGSPKAVSPQPPTVKDGSSGNPQPKPPDDRETRAREAYIAAEVLSRRSDVSFDDLLAVIEKARTPCRATPWEAKLEELRVKALKEKDSVEAQKGLTRLLDELRAAVAGDPNFARFGELQPKLQTARELASRAGPNRLAEVQQIQGDYTGRYEKTAQPFFDEINTAATVLAAERRYDEALSKIETFPLNLRFSSAWKSLEKLQQDIDQRKKTTPKK